MQYSRIKQDNLLVEVRDQRVFINGREICESQVKQAMLGNIYMMVGIVSGFLAGGFSAYVILSQLPAWAWENLY